MRTARKNAAKRMADKADAVSLWLGRLVAILLVLLVLSQALLQNDTVRLWLTNAERWEGIRLD